MEPQDPEQLPQTEPAQTLLTRTQRVVRYGAWILAGLGLVFMLALVGLWYWSAGTQSLGTLLQIVQRNMPAGSSLQIEGVSGTVRHGGHIGKLVYRLGDAQADESAGALTLLSKTLTSHGIGPFCGTVPPGCKRCMCAR